MSLKSLIDISLLIAILCFGSVGVRAAEGSAAFDACLVDLACRTRYERGVALAKMGHHDEALPEFKAAYSIKQMPWILINIGRCLHKLGQPREALRYYGRFQQADPNTGPERQQRVKGFIDESRALLDAAGPGRGDLRTPDFAKSATGEDLTLIAPTLPEPSSAASSARVGQPAPVRRRARWQIVAGAVVIGGGVLLSGFGISGFAQNGACARRSEAAWMQPPCVDTYETGRIAAGLLGGGLALSAGGVLLMAIPAQLSTEGSGPRRPGQGGS